MILLDRASRVPLPWWPCYIKGRWLTITAESPDVGSHEMELGPTTRQLTLRFQEYFVDVQDIGRLHVAAAILKKVQRQRIFGFAARYNWDEILGILRDLEPRKVFPKNFSGGQDPNEIVARPKAEQLLRDLGRDGWTTLEETIGNMVQQLRESSSARL